MRDPDAVRWIAVALALELAGCAHPHRAPASSLVVAVDVPLATTSTAEPEDADEAEGEAEDEGVAGRTKHRGRWEGHGQQDDGQSWDLVLQVNGHDQQPCATVEYPPDEGRGIPCNVEWQCDTAASTPDRLVAVERIIEGYAACIDGCRVDADLESGVIEFDCSHVDVMARARVHRVR